MTRYNLYGLFAMGWMIGPLRECKLWDTQDAETIRRTLGSCCLPLFQVYDQGFPSGIETETREAAHVLFRRVTAVLDEFETVEALRRQRPNISDAFSKFETLLEADLNRVNAFYIRDVQCYDATRLIERGEHLLPPAASSKLANYQSAFEDTRQAARAFAFELWTATGFHIARATEAIIQAYYCQEMPAGKLPTKGGQRTWVKLIEEMRGGPLNPHTQARPRQGTGDDRLLAEAEFVGKTYRNPLIHPEHSLDETEGPLLLAACVGLMTKLLGRLP